jgi:hypothetical protein
MLVMDMFYIVEWWPTKHKSLLCERLTYVHGIYMLYTYDERYNIYVDYGCTKDLAKVRLLLAMKYKMFGCGQGCTRAKMLRGDLWKKSCDPEEIRRAPSERRLDPGTRFRRSQRHVSAPRRASEKGLPLPAKLEYGGLPAVQSPLQGPQQLRDLVLLSAYHV